MELHFNIDLLTILSPNHPGSRQTFPRQTLCQSIQMQSGHMAQCPGNSWIASHCPHSWHPRAVNNQHKHMQQQPGAGKAQKLFSNKPRTRMINCKFLQVRKHFSQVEMISVLRPSIKQYQKMNVKLSSRARILNPTGAHMSPFLSWAHNSSS